MTTYERVRVRPDDGSAPVTIILRNPAACEIAGVGEVLTGVEVDREGDEVASRGADERLRIISMALVAKRTPLVMDRLTGLLTEPDQIMEEH